MDSGARSARPGAARRRGTRAGEILRIRIETGGVVFGSLWAWRRSAAGLPDPEATRLLSLAADQLALALRRDRLRQEATTVEVARRSDALKSALLDSVSHDLRTPLASIRATAGNLADPTMSLTPDGVREAAETIDIEAQRLDRLVTSVLDLSRIESRRAATRSRGLRPPELVDTAVDPAATESRGSPGLDRAARRPAAGPGRRGAARCRAGEPPGERRPAYPAGDDADDPRPGRTRSDRITLCIADNGPGVADAHLPRLFDKFYRVGASAVELAAGWASGSSVVRGMMEALGGSAVARRGEAGGLVIELELPVAPGPAGRGRAG